MDLMELDRPGADEGELREWGRHVREFGRG